MNIQIHPKLFVKFSTLLNCVDPGAVESHLPHGFSSLYIISFTHEVGIRKVLIINNKCNMVWTVSGTSQVLSVSQPSVFPLVVLLLVPVQWWLASSSVLFNYISSSDPGHVFHHIHPKGSAAQAKSSREWHAVLGGREGGAGNPKAFCRAKNASSTRTLLVSESFWCHLRSLLSWLLSLLSLWSQSKLPPSHGGVLPGSLRSWPQQKPAPQVPQILSGIFFKDHPPSTRKWETSCWKQCIFHLIISIYKTLFHPLFHLHLPTSLWGTWDHRCPFASKGAKESLRGFFWWQRRSTNPGLSMPT